MSEPPPLAERLPSLVVGDRLRLELWRADAVDEVRALVERSRPTLAKFLPWAMVEVTTEEEAKVQADAEQRWRDRLMAGWTIVEDGSIRGMLGLHRRGGPDELEIGYWLDDQATGRGLMTEACAMAIEVAFAIPAIEVVEIIHDRANARSEAVPRRLGFSRSAAFTSPPTAPSETGIKVRWCLRRDAWAARSPASVVRSTA